jgi:hypothetical protein
MSIGRPRTPVSQRFWAKVNKSGECWIWTGRPNAKGYGTIIKGGRTGGLTMANRMAWTLASGDGPPSNRLVCHICDNPPCVRNDDHGTYTVDGTVYERWGHLFLGTASANAKDEKAKGRYPSGDKNPSRMHPECLARGERQGSSKLTALEVAAIRKLLAFGTSVSAVARTYRVDRGTIRAVRDRRTWSHVP